MLTATWPVPVAQLNLMTVGNTEAELPDTLDDLSEGAQTTPPGSEGIHKLELPDDEKAD